MLSEILRFFASALISIISHFRASHWKEGEVEGRIWIRTHSPIANSNNSFPSIHCSDASTDHIWFIKPVGWSWKKFGVDVSIDLVNTRTSENKHWWGCIDHIHPQHIIREFVGMAFLISFKFSLVSTRTHTHNAWGEDRLYLVSPTHRKRITQVVSHIKTRHRRLKRFPAWIWTKTPKLYEYMYALLFYWW